MMNGRIKTFLTVMMIIPLMAGAKQGRTSDIVLGAGLHNYNGYELELSTTYLLNKYIGATIGLSIYNHFELTRTFGGFTPQGDEWRILGRDAYPDRLLLRPALRFRMPLATIAKDWYISLNTEPGLYLTPFPNEELGIDYYAKKDDLKLFPYRYDNVRNKGGEIVFWNVKNFIELHADHILIAAGYTISNFDLFNGRRNINIEGFPINQWYQKRQISHMAFVSIGYCF